MLFTGWFRAAPAAAHLAAAPVRWRHHGVLKARPIWFKPSMPIMFIAGGRWGHITMAAALNPEWITRKHCAARFVAQQSLACGLGLLFYTYVCRIWRRSPTMVP
jgi:hypothetical protein